MKLAQLVAVLVFARFSLAWGGANFIDFSTWTAGTTAQALNWTGNGTVTVNNISISSPRTGFPQSYTEVWDNTSASFPAALGSTPISASELWFNAQTGSSVSFDMNFSQPFTSQKTLFFDDVDIYNGASPGVANTEAVSIQAFDSNGVALDLSGWTRLAVDGKGTNQTNIYNTVSFSAGNTVMTILPSASNGGSDEFQPLIFLTPTAGQSIFRIHANAASWYSGTSTSGWEIGAFAPVPEPSSAVLVASLAAVTCLRRKRPDRVQKGWVRLQS